MIDGTTDGLFLDDPRFQPVLGAAEQLGVPLYLHPAPPPSQVYKATTVGCLKLSPTPSPSAAGAGTQKWASIA